MGTDGVGRDVFSRLLYATRVSLSIGVSATFFGLLIGCLVGFCSGYFGGMIDRILVWIVDVFLSIPSLFLVIVLIFVTGNSYFNLIVVLSLSGWMGIARLVRGEVLHLKDREFILAARLLGQSSAAIIRKHLLPNVLPMILSAAVLLFSDTVLGAAGLSFLGLGIQPPIPSWGNMIGESLTYIDRAWWIAVFPGLALSTLMVALYVVSEQIQEALKT
jgi:peptide/nickel transport system permease protein